jgi:hypothetical protein
MSISLLGYRSTAGSNIPCLEIGQGQVSELSHGRATQSRVLCPSYLTCYALRSFMFAESGISFFGMDCDLGEFLSVFLLAEV